MGGDASQTISTYINHSYINHPIDGFFIRFSLIPSSFTPSTCTLPSTTFDEGVPPLLTRPERSSETKRGFPRHRHQCLCEEFSLINKDLLYFIFRSSPLSLKLRLSLENHPRKIDEINNQLQTTSRYTAVLHGWRKPNISVLISSSLGLGFCNPSRAASFLLSEWRLWGFHLRCNMSSNVKQGLLGCTSRAL